MEDNNKITDVGQAVNSDSNESIGTVDNSSVKDFVKNHILLLSIIVAALLLGILLFCVFHKVGDEVYIISTDGTVSIGSSDSDILVDGYEGMKLLTGNIVVTGDKSSCVLSYTKNYKDTDNFITVGENSQVMLYDKNSGGGYKFFVSYGSVICNMTTEKTYETNVSTKLFNLFADGTITKIDYDIENEIGKVYTFDGNPYLQIIQPSGTTNAAEKLLKNSVCAVNSLEDGTVGFGCLNVGFGLDSFTAQDLKTMSGIANVWSEKLSYGSNEFEQAFQTAADKAKWVSADPVTVSLAETEVVNSDTLSETSVTTVPVTESTTYAGATQTIPNTSASTTVRNNDIEFTAFDHTTMEHIYDEDEIWTITHATSESATAATTRKTEATTAKTFTSATTTEAVTTTVPETTTAKTATSSETVVTQGNTAYVTGTKPVINTTAPTVVDTNAIFVVIFQYMDGDTEYWSAQLVRYGESPIVPTAPVIDGKYFAGWDLDYSFVTSDMLINAQFTEDSSLAANKTHTVRFYVNNELWAVETVADGGSVDVKLPVVTDSKYTFCGWSDSLTNITEDKIIFALFVTE